MNEDDIDTVIAGGMIGKFNLKAVVEAIEASNRSLHQLMHTMEHAGNYILIEGYYRCVDCGHIFAANATDAWEEAKDQLVRAVARVTDPAMDAETKELLMEPSMAMYYASTLDNFAM